MQPLDAKKLLDVYEAAQYLLGCVIVRTLLNGEELRVKIVETESYHQDDPASHTFHGKSARNQAMFGPAGHAYIYFTYGVHWCFNVTAGKAGHGAGVLIRAGAPLRGIETMRQNRRLPSPEIKSVANGPAKLAQALQIDKALYGHDLSQPPLQILVPEKQTFQITKTTRIGISKAVDEIARFYITDNEFISKR